MQPKTRETKWLLIFSLLFSALFLSAQMPLQRANSSSDISVFLEENQYVPLNNKRLSHLAKNQVSISNSASKNTESIPFPPTNLKGHQTLNRFISQTDVINVIMWTHPQNGSHPITYNIYSDATLKKLIGRTSAHDKLRFKDHNRKKNHTYTYFITSVDNSGNESIAVGIAFVGAKTHLISPALNVISLSIEPSNEVVLVGENQQYSASAMFNDGTSADVTSQVAWSSSNTEVATISVNGLANAIGDGETEISALLNFVRAQAKLTVEGMLTSIAVEPSTETLEPGQQQQFTATGKYSNGESDDLTLDVIWSSSQTTIAKINQQGLAEGLSDGTVTITATFESISGQATLTVIGTLSSIAIIPGSVTLDVDQQQNYKAIAIYTDGSAEDVTNSVTWNSSNTIVATINKNGIATALSSGTCNITAQFNSITSDFASLTVRDAILQSITIDQQGVTIPDGTTQQYTATGHYSNGSQEPLISVTWTSSNPHAATIDSTGLATGQNAGQTTIITASNGTTTPGTSILTISSAILQSITIDQQGVTIPDGTTQQYTATGHYSDGSQSPIRSVMWTSSNDIAATISSTGLATGQNAGQTTIITASSGGTTPGTSTLIIGAARLDSITIDQQSVIIPDGTTQQYTATGNYSDGTQNSVTSAIWTSSNLDAATISSTGLATGQNAGKTTTITANSGNATPGTSTLTIAAARLNSITINEQQVTIPDGTTQQYSATGNYSDGTQIPLSSVNWSSTNPDAATIDSNGLATGQNAGKTTTITASSGGATPGTSTLTIAAARLNSITINEQNITIPDGTTQQYTATGNYSDGSQSALKSALWTSSNPDAATIDSNGLATGQNAGKTTTITASSGGATPGTSGLTISAAILQSITIDQQNVTLPAIAPQQYTATGHYSDGSSSTISGATWASSNTSAATINSITGLAATVNGGQTTDITARFGSATPGTSTLTVSQVGWVRLLVSPGGQQSTPVNIPLQYTATGYYSDGSTINLTTYSTWTPSAIINRNGVAFSSTPYSRTSVTAQYQNKTNSPLSNACSITITP